MPKGRNIVLAFWDTKDCDVDGPRRKREARPQPLNTVSPSIVPAGTKYRLARTQVAEECVIELGFPIRSL